MIGEGSVLRGGNNHIDRCGGGQGGSEGMMSLVVVERVHAITVADIVQIGQVLCGQHQVVLGRRGFLRGGIPVVVGTIQPAIPDRSRHTLGEL